MGTYELTDSDTRLLNQIADLSYRVRVGQRAFTSHIAVSIAEADQVSEEVRDLSLPRPELTERVKQKALLYHIPAAQAWGEIIQDDALEDRLDALKHQLTFVD